MAHEIEDNFAFYASNTPAWHKLGTVLTDAPSIEEAWKLAYPFTLIDCAIEATITDDSGLKSYMPIESHKAVFRSDGKHIGTVGSDYHLEQPYEVLDFFRPFLESGLVELEAGGSLRDGKRMWALGKIKHSETEIVKGDTVKAYLLAATGFDGSLRKIIKLCETRVVCANTVAAALSENTAEWTNKHTVNFQARAVDIQKQVGIALGVHKRSIEAYQSLARKQMDFVEQSKYIVQVITGDTPTKDWSPQLTTKVQVVIDLIDNQRGLEYVPAIRGTAWQAYNAVSEYVTHHAARTEDTRVNNQWFDASTQGLNNRALELALAA